MLDQKTKATDACKSSYHQWIASNWNVSSFIGRGEWRHTSGGHKGGASATWQVTPRIARARASRYSACLKLNSFAGGKPMQINQAGSCTQERGESNGIGFVAYRRVVPCCFLMFFKKLSRFVLAADRFFFSIEEKGYMRIIKLWYKHIAVFPIHQSNESCINFD